METLSKEVLFNSAKKLFLKYGVKSVSMDDIARLLGISKKTIYTFINNKKGLVHAVVAAYLKDEEKILSKISEKSKNAVDEMISISRHVDGTLKSMKPSLTYDLKKYHPATWQLIEGGHFDFIEKNIQTNLRRGIKEGYYRKSLRVEIISKLFVNISRIVAEGDIIFENTIKQSEIYESSMLYHMHGIINEKGRKELSHSLKMKKS